MLDTALLTLDQSYGQESARNLTSAYQSALLVLSVGRVDRMPDRVTRLAVVEAMIGEGRRNGFDVAAMARAGVAAGRP